MEAYILRTKATTILFIFLLSIFNVSPLNLKAKTYRATQSGEWEDPNTWGKNGPETEITGDRIIIPKGIVVNLGSDLLFFKDNSELVIDGSLNGEDFIIEIVGGKLLGSGEVSLSELSLYEGSVFEFSGIVYVYYFTSSIASLDLDANLNIGEELNIKNGVVNIRDGYISLLGDATISLHNAKFEGNENIQPLARYNLIYTGGSNYTGFELIQSQLLYMECSLDNSSDILVLNQDVQMKGNITVNSGILSFGGRKLIVEGDLDCIKSGLLACDVSSEMVLRGNCELAFSPAMNDIGRLSISGADTKVSINNPLYVIKLLDLSSGKLKAHDNLVVKGYFSSTGNSKFKAESDNNEVTVVQ